MASNSHGFIDELMDSNFIFKLMYPIRLLELRDGDIDSEWFQDYCQFTEIYCIHGLFVVFGGLVIFAI